MSTLPARRLLVYVAAGLVVLVVGTVGLLATRDRASGEIIVSAPGPASAADNSIPTAGLAAEAVGPTVSEQKPLIYVQVTGAVRRPGVYQVPADARVFQVVQEAGGFTEDADQEAVPLAARVTDGCRLAVPRLGEAAQEPVLSSASSATSGGLGTAGVVSLNSATLQELDLLPGIGPALARQIIEYREAKGPFTSIEQLKEVPGIGPAKFEQLKTLVGL